MADFKASGGCLCGGVQYEISLAPAQILHCHCSMCRRTTGAGFVTHLAIRFPEGFRFLANSTLKEYESSPGQKRMFCGKCGGGIACKHGQEPNTIWPNAGTVNGDLGGPIEGHIFVGSKAPWVQINDGLPQCQEGELWKLDVAK